MEMNWDQWNKLWALASNAGAKVADVLAAHRFVNPAVGKPNSEHCFCGWTGGDHAAHVEEKVQFFNCPKPPSLVKKRPVTRKRV